jgi:hypothetical protein
MTALNMVLTASVYGKTAAANLSTVLSNVIVNNLSSSTLVKVNHLMFSNYGSVTVQGNVFLYRYSTSNGNYITNNINVPANSTLVVLGKDTPIYLEEGDVVQASTSTANSLSVISSYENIS